MNEILTTSSIQINRLNNDPADKMLILIKYKYLKGIKNMIL